MNSPWVEHLGWSLIHFLWQGALIAAMYAVTRRSRTPQRRYFLACLALAAMVAAPVVTYVATTPASVPANPYVGTIPVSSAVADSASTHPVTFSSTARALHDDVMPWLVLAWFAGATIFWIRLTGAWLVATRMRSMLVRPAPREWQRRLDEIAARIRVSRPVKLIVSAVVQVPTVVGWLRPVVLMPIGALTGLPPEHIEALLAHELAHIRRHDYLVNILQSIAEALLFYHPAASGGSVYIKPNNLSGNEVHGHNSPGRLNVRMSARHLIQDAFAVKDFQILGGPAWLGNNNYDFIASTATPIKLDDQTFQPYLQSLLADRFQLKYHRETKESPVYFLVAAKTGRS